MPGATGRGVSSCAEISDSDAAAVELVRQNLNDACMRAADTTAKDTNAVEDGEEPSHSHASRNLCVLALQQITLRVGWIFKTESVMIPAFVDSIAGSGLIRGYLPVLNRLGQSIPQFLFADFLRAAPLKRRLLGWTAVLMGVPFLVLSGLLQIPGAVGSVWLPAIFMVLYLFFFSMTGLNQLSFGTVTGKLIPANRRGRLIAISGVLSVTLAITAAWNLMPGWLALGTEGYSRIFLFVGSFFCLAGTASLLLREDPDDYERKPRANPFRDGYRRVKADPHLARVLFVGMLFVCSLLLTPHYQALALGGKPNQSGLMFWVVSQNASAGLMALVSGLIADRFGFRLSMRVMLFLAACCPLVAIAVSVWADPDWFVLPFVLFGAIPNTFRTLDSYALELTNKERHAQYISTMKLFMPVALVLSPLVGALIDGIGFAPVFIAIGLINMAGVVMTFFIIEPRTAPELRATGQ